MNNGINITYFINIPIVLMVFIATINPTLGNVNCDYLITFVDVGETWIIGTSAIFYRKLSNVFVPIFFCRLFYWQRWLYYFKLIAGDIIFCPLFHNDRARASLFCNFQKFQKTPIYIACCIEDWVINWPLSRFYC